MISAYEGIIHVKNFGDLQKTINILKILIQVLMFQKVILPPFVHSYALIPRLEQQNNVLLRGKSTLCLFHIHTHPYAPAANQVNPSTP
jgi:hypothetical protein